MIISDDSYNAMLRIVTRYESAYKIADFQSMIVNDGNLKTSYTMFEEAVLELDKAEGEFYAHPFTVAWDNPTDFAKQAQEFWESELPPDAIPF